MSKRIFTKLFIAVCVLCTLTIGDLIAQTPWNGSFGNEWLQNKYNQKWLKISVSEPGVYRVTLPGDFMNGAAANTLHLYHRGEEVALISASTTQVEFYGVPNDGSSDALLYRPTSARVNPYYSMYSDESAYFLTVGSPDGKRAVSENIADANGSVALSYHVQTDVTKFLDDYTHASQYSIRPANLNSFMEDGQTRSSYRYNDDATNPIHFGYVKDAATNQVLRADDFPALELKNQFGTEQPLIKVLVHGRSDYAPNGSNSRNVHFYMGKDKANMVDVGQVSIAGFKPGLITVNGNLDHFLNGKSIVGFRIDSPKQFLYFDRFSVTYYEMTYKQQINMQSKTSYTFNFEPTNAGTKNQIAIAAPPASGTLRFFDITDPKNPRVISGNAANLLFTRPNNQAMNLLATTVVTDLNTGNGKVSAVQFSPINKADFDYLIVTNSTLQGAAGEFASYRKNLSPGRKYKTGIFKITDLYNQFNYGEPSPLAIRRFVDFIVSDGNKDRYLLLMGKSVSTNYKIKKEIPDEVPTWAFPGSDVLIVEGLQGTPQDVPVIPVGRIPTDNNAQAIDYLNKVKDYEAATTNLGWRRNVAHISGGKTAQEVEDHRIFLEQAALKVKSDAFKGKVFAAVKPLAQASTNPVQLDTLKNVVNFPAPAPGKPGGVGMITYFGHSAPYQTDFNFGYVSDANKGYSNSGKYPIMFYNGCDILNVFSDNFATTVNTSSSRPQSLDWLLSAGRGAVAVFGNTWSGYATSCNDYMQRIYTEMFTKTDATRPTLGKILQNVSQQTKQAGGFRIGAENARTNIVYVPDQAQILQTLLLGDPALVILLTTEGGLPVELVSFTAKNAGPSQVELNWKTSSEVNNSHFIIERSYNAKNFEEIGRVEGKGDSEVEVSYSFMDSKPLSGTSYYRLKQVDESFHNAEGVLVEGKATLSRIVSIERAGTSLIVAHPNPTTDYVEITIDAPVAVKSWSVLDLNGRVRKAGTGKKADLNSLSTGNYIIKILTENNDVYYQKVLKK